MKSQHVAASTQALQAQSTTNPNIEKGDVYKALPWQNNFGNLYLLVEKE